MSTIEDGPRTLRALSWCDAWRCGEIGPFAAMRETFTFLEVVRLIVLKDLAIELRSREIVYDPLFAISCVLVFAFGLVQEGTAEQETAPAILWIAIAFFWHAGNRTDVQARAPE